MPRIRQPVEFNDAAINNNYRAVQIDANAATAPYAAGAEAFQTVNDIVNNAAALGHRANARADSNELETRLLRIQNELENEEIPEGEDEEAWLRTMPDRFRARADAARRDIARARGWRASNVYSSFFSPAADETINRFNAQVVERSQLRVVDWARGARISERAILEARALDPEMDAEARDQAYSRVVEINNEMAREGLITRTQAAEANAVFERQRTEFLRTEARHQQVLELAAEIRANNQTPSAQVAAANRIEDLDLRRDVIANIIEDNSREAVAFNQTTEQYLQHAQQAVERNPGGWQRSLTPAMLEHLRRAGVMDDLRALQENITANAIAASGGGDRRLSVRSALFVDHLRDMASHPQHYAIIRDLDLARPLPGDIAEALNDALGLQNNFFQEGMVLSQLMTAEDFREIYDLRRALASGRFENATGDQPRTLIAAEVDELTTLAIQAGILPGGTTPGDRSLRQKFQMFARRAVQDLMPPNEFRRLSPEDRDRIIRLAARDANNNWWDTERQFSAGGGGGRPVDRIEDIPVGGIEAAIRDILQDRSASNRWNRLIQQDMQSYNGEEEFPDEDPQYMGPERSRMILERYGRMLREYSR